MNYAIKWGIHVDGNSLETEITTSEFPIGKASVEQILASEEINPKEQDHESHSQGSKQES